MRMRVRVPRSENSIGLEKCEQRAPVLLGRVELEHVVREQTRRDPRRTHTRRLLAHRWRRRRLCEVLRRVACTPPFAPQHKQLELECNTSTCTRSKCTRAVLLAGDFSQNGLIKSSTHVQSRIRSNFLHDELSKLYKISMFSLYMRELRNLINLILMCHE